MTARSDIRPPTTRDLRGFAYGVGLVLAALGVLWLRRGHPIPASAAGAIGCALLLAGALAPRRLAAPYRAWMTLALAMSRVTTPIFMGAVYLLVLTPFGLAMRLFGRRPLARRPGADSYWVERPAGSRRSDLRRQF